MRRIVGILGLAVLVLLLSTVPALGDSPDVFPKIIPLPDGFQPEGIVSGRGTDLFAGSLATGAIYKADVRTGEGNILIQPEDDRVAVGLSYDHRANLLFVAGGGTGMGYVYDAGTGATEATYQLTTEAATFVNDVVATRSAAYFTDSAQPVLYKVPLGRDPRLPDESEIVELPLGGDFVFEPDAFNANGIDSTPNGRWLIVVHSARGELYRVDPNTGEATLIDLGGETVPNGDGILLQGRTLYVVQNFLNQISVVRLDPGLTSGTIVDTITDPNFRIPTTIAKVGHRLYVVNARFDTEPGPDVEYEVVQVRKPAR